jgi:hypothetical protein
VSARFALLLAIMLAACAWGGNSPQAQCERQADDDPAVVAIYSGTNGAYTQPWIQRDQLLAAKRQAVLRCMRQKGLAPPGGVEPVVRN